MANSAKKPLAPNWARRVLAAAGIYNLAWGLFVIAFPAAIFQATGIRPPNYLAIWQCVGMMVGVFGIGYLIAARDPFRHWPIVLVGLLGKVCGPIGFVVSAMQGELPWAWGATIITNDLVWWLPFAGILYLAYKDHTASAAPSVTLAEIVATVESHRGATIGELSADRPLLLVFLRHSGCTFCREALSDIARLRPAIEAAGARIAVVSMSQPLAAAQLLAGYRLDDLHRYSDPDCRMYTAFGLSRGTLPSLLGIKVWRRAIGALLRGHGWGLPDGDGFQMPGVFVIRNGAIVASQRHKSAADRPDYLRLAGEGVGALANGLHAAPSF